MPYTLKPNKLFAKDPNGDGYLPQNIVTDKATEDAVAEIQSAARSERTTIHQAGVAEMRNVDSKGAAQIDAIQAKVDSLSNTINAADAKITEINSAGTTQVDAVNAAGTTQVDAVNVAGKTQTDTIDANIAEINSTGETQVNAVNNAGKTQTDAIDAKTDEIDQKISSASEIIDRIDAAESLITELGNLIDLVHPIGSIYISVSNEKTPDQMFGGTWEQIKDRFLLTAGDTYHVGDADGGEATHKLTKEELPVEHMTLRNLYRVDNGETISIMAQTGTDGNVVPDSTIAFNAAHVSAATTAHATVYTYGGDQPHNNMPPYTIVYAWKRVA